MATCTIIIRDITGVDPGDQGGSIECSFDPPCPKGQEPTLAHRLGDVAMSALAQHMAKDRAFEFTARRGSEGQDVSTMEEVAVPGSTTDKGVEPVSIDPARTKAIKGPDATGFVPMFGSRKPRHDN